MRRPATRVRSKERFVERSTLERLTPREYEVWILVAQGHTNRQIADELLISVGTVKVHVARILQKLDVNDRTQAAVRAVQLGVHQEEVV